jgi:hypothetical protein
MKLIATMFGEHEDEWGGRAVGDIEVEFDDVKEVVLSLDNMFFTVVKNNGGQHAIRIGKIKKYILSN